MHRDGGHVAGGRRASEVVAHGRDGGQGHVAGAEALLLVTVVHDGRGATGKVGALLGGAHGVRGGLVAAAARQRGVLVAERREDARRHLALLLAQLVVGVLGRVVDLVAVLARVGHFVLEHLDEEVKGNGEDGAHAGAHPVDPVLGVELARDDAGTDAAGWVQRASSVVDANQLGNEESQTDTDGSNKGGTMLLLCQHENGKDKLCSHERLDKETLRN